MSTVRARKCGATASLLSCFCLYCDQKDNACERCKGTFGGSDASFGVELFLPMCTVITNSLQEGSSMALSKCYVLGVCCPGAGKLQLMSVISCFSGTPRDGSKVINVLLVCMAF